MLACEIDGYSQFFHKTGPYPGSELRSTVTDDLPWDSKVSEDMLEEQLSRCEG